MSKEEIKKLVWNWEMFVSNKEKTSINEEVISEYIDEFINQNKDEENINN